MLRHRHEQGKSLVACWLKVIAWVHLMTEWLNCCRSWATPEAVVQTLRSSVLPLARARGAIDW
jgi:hypothetical protein